MSLLVTMESGTSRHAESDRADESMKQPPASSDDDASDSDSATAAEVSNLLRNGESWLYESAWGRYGIQQHASSVCKCSDDCCCVGTDAGRRCACSLASSLYVQLFDVQRWPLMGLHSAMSCEMSSST